MLIYGDECVAGVCVYKGAQYTQGQRWQDGCDYNCVCDDGMTGKYTCTARFVGFGYINIVSNAG